MELYSHRPSEGARRRAEAAGLDLEQLKREDPDTYRMLCATPLVRIAAELRAAAEPCLQAAFGDQHLFEAGSDGEVLILAFPGPGSSAIERFDELMGEAAESVTHRHGYYRVIRDRRGERREFEIATAPDAWGGRETMVGPFDDESLARDWGQEMVVGRAGFTYDVLNYAGSWFCDVFSAEV